jgi:hypothetical protein
MPVFQETSSAARDLRVLPSRARPLPRLSPRPSDPAGDAVDQREVVVIGVSRHAVVGWSILSYVTIGWTEWTLPYTTTGALWHYRFVSTMS